MHFREKVWFIDLETYPIVEGEGPPKPVCASIGNNTSEKIKVLSWEEAKPLLRKILDSDSKICFHNARFDVGVMAKYLGYSPHKLYKEGRVLCTKLLCRAYDITQDQLESYVDCKGKYHHKKGYSLGQLIYRFFGEVVEGKKAEEGEFIWRSNYYLLDGLPVSRYPKEALEYCVSDIKNLKRLFNKVNNLWAGLPELRSHKIIPDYALQGWSDYCLGIIEDNGLTVNQNNLEAAKIEFFIEITKTAQKLFDAALLYPNKKRPSGYSAHMESVRAAFEEAFRACGKAPILTATGLVSTGQPAMDFLADFGELTPEMELYSRLKTLEKWQSSYIDKFDGEVTIHPYYTSLINTGRTSASGPPVQQLPRGPVIRRLLGCNPDEEMISADANSFELRTLAGFFEFLGMDSVLLDIFKSGKDPHEMLRKQLGEDAPRLLSKIGNFGVWGGMGEAGLISFGRGYGVSLTEREAQQIIFAMKSLYTEFAWFKHNEAVNRYSHHETYTSGRLRYTENPRARMNNNFQGSAADAIKYALCMIQEKIDSDEIPAKIRLFLHDEIFMSVPRGEAPTYQNSLSRAMQRYIEEYMHAVDGVTIEFPCSSEYLGNNLAKGE